MTRLLLAIRDLSEARSLDEIQQVVRVAARDITNADGATLVLSDGEDCYYVDEDAIAPLWKGRRFPKESCVSGWVMINRRPAVISDIYADQRIPHDAYRETFVKSLAMVPIRSREPIGAIGNYWASFHAPSSLDVWVLQALADATAIAIENVLLKSAVDKRVDERTRELVTAFEEVARLSATDELTGLSNRRGFYQLGGAVAGSGVPFLIVYVDVDHLKQVNDRHGHAAGDAVIRGVAALLRSSLGQPDVLARMGGDEFCAILRHPYPKPARLKRAIRAAAAGLRPLAEDACALGVSIGMVEVAGGNRAPLETLLARADALMYEDKHSK